MIGSPWPGVRFAATPTKPTPKREPYRPTARSPLSPRARALRRGPCPRDRTFCPSRGRSAVPRPAPEYFVGRRAWDVICQWDDDDCYHPERLAVQLAHMLDCNARACCLTDHLQLLDAGPRTGMVGLDPRRQIRREPTHSRHRDGVQRSPLQLPRNGAPSLTGARFRVSRPALSERPSVAPLSGMGEYLFCTLLHGRNTFSEGAPLQPAPL